MKDPLCMHVNRLDDGHPQSEMNPGKVPFLYEARLPWELVFFVDSGDPEMELDEALDTVPVIREHFGHSVYGEISSAVDDVVEGFGKDDFNEVKAKLAALKSLVDDHVSGDFPEQGTENGEL